MEAGKDFGCAYLESYAEIPPELIEDDYLAAKKLAGHRRLFEPGSYEEEACWFMENKDALIIAYGEKRVWNFFKTTLKIEDPGF